MLTSRINKYSKSTVTHLSSWRRSHDIVRHTPKVRLTDTELYDFLIEHPFNKGDIIFYGPESQQSMHYERMGYVFDLQWDADKLQYSYSDKPKPFAILPLNYASPHYRTPHFEPLGRNPICRWDDCEGNSLLRADLKEKIFDDYVQNYIEKYAKHEFIR